MGKAPNEPANIIDPAPKEPTPKPEPSRIVVQAEIDYDKLGDSVVSKLSASMKSISDPISEMMGILKPAPVVPPITENPPPKTETKRGIIFWLD